MKVKLYQRAIIISLCILFILLLYISISFINQNAVVVINEPIIGEVKLNHNDSVNFIHLLKTMKKIDVSISEAENATILEGKIISAFNTNKFIIANGSIIIIDNQVFSCDQILYDMAYLNVFSAAKLSESIANCEISIEAKDVNKEIQIKGNDLAELASSIKNASLDKDDSNLTEMATGKLFPDYHIIIKKGEQILDIEVQNDKLFYFDRLMRINLYHNGGMAWNYCNNKLPVIQPNTSNIKYLLMAKSLTSPELGELNNRIIGISRLFSMDKPVNDKIDDVLYTFIYKYENGKDVIVKVGKDKFELYNQVFYLPEIGGEVLSAAKAG